MPSRPVPRHHGRDCDAPVGSTLLDRCDDPMTRMAVGRDRSDLDGATDRVEWKHRWTSAGLVVLAAGALGLVVYALAQGVNGTGGGSTLPPQTFVGRESCVACHEAASEAWRGSDHDNAMAIATDSTVRGDFDDTVFQYGDLTARFYKRDGGFYVRTQGTDGTPTEFRIAYTFGIDPLQQYLIPFPGGRLQAFSVAWDTERQQWFYLRPGEDISSDDWLHWTRGAQTWNGMCAACHSTNLVKGYDFETRTFSTTWSEIDVSCEACHGPASRHLEWAEGSPADRPALDDYGLVEPTSDITSRELAERCAPCHSLRTGLGHYDPTRTDLLDNVQPTLLEEGSYFADGQILDEVYVYGSFVQSKMFHGGVRCTDCHDAHSLRLRFQGNELCAQCHAADTYDTYDHHFHEGVVDGQPSQGVLCVRCHMPERPYMVVDWRADHSLRVPRPDLTLEIGVPNACAQSGCHDDRTDEWVAQRYDEWYGPVREPHYGTVLDAGRHREPDAEAELILLAGDTTYPVIVRATALSLLGAYAGTESADAFHRALEDEEPLVRLTAVEHFTPLSADELVGRVTPLLFDPVRAVRMQATSRLAGVPMAVLTPDQQRALLDTRAEYVEAMEYSLDFAFAGHNLGNLFSQLGEPDRAETYYRAAIEIDDLFYPAKANLAVLLNSMGRNEEAEQLLRDIVRDNPDNYDAMYSLGLLLAELGRMEEATENMGRAAEGMPARARIHYNHALLLQALGRADEAEEALLQALALEPDEFDFLYALADHYLKQGRLPEALETADRMVAIHPQNPAGRDARAYIERALEDAGGE
jgi:tetratricopeptide (TPR) repeat protein